MFTLRCHRRHTWCNAKPVRCNESSVWKPDALDNPLWLRVGNTKSTVPIFLHLGGCEHAAAAAHVAEGTLPRPVRASARYTRDTGHRAASSPTLCRGRHASLKLHGIRLTVVLCDARVHAADLHLENTLLVLHAQVGWAPVAQEVVCYCCTHFLHFLHSLRQRAACQRVKSSAGHRCVY
jgi:hypothetical protein